MLPQQDMIQLENCIYSYSRIFPALAVRYSALILLQDQRVARQGNQTPLGTCGIYFVTRRLFLPSPISPPASACRFSYKNQRLDTWYAAMTSIFLLGPRAAMVLSSRSLSPLLPFPSAVFFHILEIKSIKEFLYKRHFFFLFFIPIVSSGVCFCVFSSSVNFFYLSVPISFIYFFIDGKMLLDFLQLDC